MATKSFDWTKTTVYHPVANFSIRLNTSGEAQLSRKGPHEFTPQDGFTFLEKTGGIPYVTPISGPHAGEKLATHKNHFDAEDGYNVARQSGGSVDDRIAMTERRIDQATRTLDEQQALLGKLHVERQEQIAAKIKSDAKAKEMQAAKDAETAKNKAESEAKAEELKTKAAEATEEIETGPKDEDLIAAEQEAAEANATEETESEDEELQALIDEENAIKEAKEAADEVLAEEAGDTDGEEVQNKDEEMTG
jgi:hypothetical protein